MIKINYTIERDEGNEVIEFKPNLIPTELPNIAYIQGPNSSGKSTLLNIIALAFFGDTWRNFCIATFNIAVRRNNAEVNRKRSSRKWDIPISVGMFPVSLSDTKTSKNNVATMGIMK